MRKPLIGVSPLFDTQRESLWMLSAYTEALAAAGGIPVILPLDSECARDVFDRLDGVLFTGGQDVDPKLYGEEMLSECGEVCGIRDDFETALLELCLSNDKPMLAICRGIQVLNVHMGGTLYQDLPTYLGTQVKHSYQPTNRKPSHTVEVAPHSLLCEITGASTLEVNSCHHQGIKRLATGLIFEAVSPDGLVEAVSCKGLRFALAVQWHPEWLYRENEAQRALFKGFVRAAGQEDG